MAGGHNLGSVHVEHLSNPERQQVAPSIDQAGNQDRRGEGFQLGQGQGHPHIWSPQSIQDSQALADLQDPFARVAPHWAEGSAIAACLHPTHNPSHPALLDLHSKTIPISISLYTVAPPITVSSLSRGSEMCVDCTTFCMGPEP